jgi:hypothetical protein
MEPWPQTVWPSQKSPAHAEHPPPGGDAANAGVLRLVITGVAHATAPAAPMRRNIVRRETD